MSNMDDIEIAERTKLSLHMELKGRNPWEIIDVIFDYFAIALRDASKEKIDEFFIHFEVGIRAQIVNRKQVEEKIKGYKEQYG